MLMLVRVCVHTLACMSLRGHRVLRNISAPRAIVPFPETHCAVGRITRISCFYLFLGFLGLKKALKICKVVIFFMRF